MNKEDKEILRSTLMAFENNSSIVRDIRLRNFNYLPLDEIKALLNIEQKIYDVKSTIIDVILNEVTNSQENDIRRTYEFKNNPIERPNDKRPNDAFLHENFD